LASDRLGSEPGKAAKTAFPHSRSLANAIWGHPARIWLATVVCAIPKIINETGRFRIINGFKRARIIFAKHPDATLIVGAIKAADAERFRLAYKPQRAFELMRAVPLWVSASDENPSGGDVIAFTVNTQKGAPRNEGDGGWLANLVAIRGLEVIR
jgi:hypothetical protein